MEREETCTSNDYTPNAVHVLQFGKKLNLYILCNIKDPKFWRMKYLPNA